MAVKKTIRKIHLIPLRKLPLILSVILFASPAVFAVEIEAELRAGIAESDNIARTSSTSSDETIRTGGFSLSILQQTRTLDLELRSEADYLDYENDTFDEEWISGASLSLAYRMFDGAVTWTLLDNYGQQLIDPLASPNPGNRENINYLTTGPSLSLQLDARHGIGADVTYSTVDYEERPIDNDRMRYGLWFARQMNSESQISLNVTSEDIEFAVGGFANDYNVLETFVRYSRTNNRNTFSVDLGYTEIDVPALGGSGQLIRIDWLRNISDISTLTLVAGSRFSDNGDIFRFLQLNNPRTATAADAPATSQPFRFNFAFLNYNFAPNRTSLRLTTGYSTEEFETMPDEDREILNVSLILSRDISRNLFGTAGVRFNRRDFTFINRKDDDLSASVVLGYRLGTSFSLQAEQQFLRRNSSVAIRDFEENRTIFRITYTPQWTR